MLNITDNAKEQKIVPLFRLGFRPLFLFGSAFSCVAIALWLSVILGFSSYQPFGGSLWWHAHEMLFGFGTAIVVGFLLTAVQNWTGIAGVRGWPLFGLFMLWLTARLMLAVNIDSIITTVIDLLFLPTAAIMLALPIIKIGQKRNLFFVPVLLLLFIANLLTHISIYSPEFQGFKIGSYAAVMLIMLLMMVMGGRVIPFFTANGTGTTKAIPIKSLEIVALASGWLIMVMFLTGLAFHPDFNIIIAGFFAIAAVSHLIRWFRWRIWITLSVPLLWSLHIAYLFIPLGCALLAIHFGWGGVALQTALHAVTIGAMGTMILAMIARVSLGHSGRPLKPHWLMGTAFMSLILAAIVRVVGAIWLHEYIRQSLAISGMLWILGFSLFVIIYFPVLTQPRADGRPG